MYVTVYLTTADGSKQNTCAKQWSIGVSGSTLKSDLLAFTFLRDVSALFSPSGLRAAFSTCIIITSRINVFSRDAIDQ